MRLAHRLLFGPAVALLVGVASGAAAQSPSGRADPAARPGEAVGLRYLSWTGRSEAASAPVVAPGPSQGRPRRPNPVIPHGGMAQVQPAARPGLTPAPGSVPGRLTPANAWLARTAPPPPAVEAPPPAPVSRPAPQPQPRAPMPAPVQRPATTTAMPEYLPDRSGQPAPSATFEAAPRVQPPAPSMPTSVAPDAAYDPMAPRRDAPIFRMQQTPEPVPQAQPQPAPTTDKPADPDAPRRVATVSANPDDSPAAQGARYYSVHRRDGRTPDPVTLPEPTYVDALAVTMTETIASQDLAVPEAGPSVIRDRNGKLRAAPAPSDGDHQ